MKQKNHQQSTCFNLCILSVNFDMFLDVSGVRTVEITRGCDPQTKDGCWDGSYNGISVYICACNSDYCNSSQGLFVSMKLLILLTSLSVLYITKSWLIDCLLISNGYTLFMLLWWSNHYCLHVYIATWNLLPKFRRKKNHSNINDSLYWFWVRNFVPVSEKTVAKLF